jgi:hypothetical protein
METQQALSGIKQRFSEKLAAVAAAAHGKLMTGAKSSTVPFSSNDLSQFRKEVRVRACLRACMHASTGEEGPDASMKVPPSYQLAARQR